MPAKANGGGSNRPRRAPQTRRTPALSPAQMQSAQAAAPAEPAAAGVGQLRAVRAAGAVPASARLTRDYGYVRGELLRIAVLAVVIFSAIGALAVFWR